MEIIQLSPHYYQTTFGGWPQLMPFGVNYDRFSLLLINYLRNCPEENVDWDNPLPHANTTPILT
jgi:hypothetical protein